MTADEIDPAQLATIASALAAGAQYLGDLAPVLAETRAAMAEIAPAIRAARVQAAAEATWRQEVVPHSGPPLWAVNEQHGSLGTVVAWRWARMGEDDRGRFSASEAPPPVMLEPIVVWNGAGGSVVKAPGEVSIHLDRAEAAAKANEIRAARADRRQRIEAGLKR